MGSVLYQISWKRLICTCGTKFTTKNQCLNVILHDITCHLADAFIQSD